MILSLNTELLGNQKTQAKGFLAADFCWQDSMYLLQARKYLGFLLEVRKASGKHLAMGMLQGGVTKIIFSSVIL